MKKASAIVWAGRVITALVGGLFLFSALPKFIPSMNPEMPAGMEKMGLTMSLLPTIGTLEVISALLFLIPWTSVMGAVMLTGYLGGAIMTHLRVEDSVMIHIAIAGFMWLGIYLREPRLHAVLPLRKGI